MSSLTDFENCPKRFYHTKIAKTHVPPQTEQMKYGKEVHRQLECYVKEAKPVSHALRSVTPVLDQLREKGYELYAELKIGIDRFWNPVAFSDEAVWGRGIVDLAALNTKTRTAILLDYKTGKRKRDASQLEFYGAIFYKIGFRVVRSWFLWLGEKKHDEVVINSRNISHVIERINNRAAEFEVALKENNFPAKQSPLCAWCPLVFECDEASAYSREKARKMRGH